MIQKNRTKVFKLASIGGTFNNLHKGHKEYIDIALQNAEKVHIYITSDSYAKKVKHYSPLKYSDRVLKIMSYLGKINQVERCEFFAIENNEMLKERVIVTNYDLVVVEPAYFRRFRQYNLEKIKLGRKGFSILLKQRTVDLYNRDISSTVVQRNRFAKRTLQTL